MSSTKSQVAVATNIPNLTSGQQQQQKDYNSEESLGRQNSFGLNRRVSWILIINFYNIIN